MSKQSKITQYLRKPGKSQLTREKPIKRCHCWGDTILKLSDKDFKTAITKMFGKWGWTLFKRIERYRFSAKT